MDRLITNITQVGLVVRDVQKAAEVFSKGFGQDLLNVRFGKGSLPAKRRSAVL